MNLRALLPKSTAVNALFTSVLFATLLTIAGDIIGEMRFPGAKLSFHLTNSTKRHLLRFKLLEPFENSSAKLSVLKPVFVTAWSKNHFWEALNLLATMQTYPFIKDKKIVAYDIGMEDFNKQQVVDAHGDMVEFRQFPFEDYPKNVRNLIEYRWKPLIIAQMLLEHPFVFWLDASLLFKYPDRDINKVYELIEWEIDRADRLPLTMFTSSGHTIFPATAPETLRYFAVAEKYLKTLMMYESGTVLYFASGRNRILKWHVLCALEPNCMAPIGANLFCNFKGETKLEQWSNYADCHRFDQSVLNLIVSNLANFDPTKYHRSEKMQIHFPLQVNR